MIWVHREIIILIFTIIVYGEDGIVGIVVFLFLPRIEAFSNLEPPVRHFLNATIEEREASNTRGDRRNAWDHDKSAVRLCEGD